MRKDESSKPWDGFNGTKEEWAWHQIETFMLPSAKDYDLVQEEAVYRILLKERRTATMAKQPTERDKDTAAIGAYMAWRDDAEHEGLNPDTELRDFDHAMEIGFHRGVQWREEFGDDDPE